METAQRKITFFRGLVCTVVCLGTTAHAAWARSRGSNIEAEMCVAFYLVLAFPAGLAWYDFLRST